MECFEMIRRLDGRIERFDLVGGSYHTLTRGGFEIRRDDTWGWAAFDPKTGDLAGRPWDAGPVHGAVPPKGDWVGRDGDMSYVYTLTEV
jgi:hypothetical protein